MKTIEIYCNYGVLAAEKRKVYTYGEQHPMATCSDVMTVFVPDKWELYENQAGELCVTAPWKWNYEIKELLSDLNGRPVFKALDNNGHQATQHLYTAEQLEEKRKERENK